jgi:hypothetical protein
MASDPRTATHVSLNERLVFEEGSPGRRGFNLPPLDAIRPNCATT